jgi:hypothetical protein
MQPARLVTVFTWARIVTRRFYLKAARSSQGKKNVACRQPNRDSYIFAPPSVSGGVLRLHPVEASGREASVPI